MKPSKRFSKAIGDSDNINCSRSQYHSHFEWYKYHHCFFFDSTSKFSSFVIRSVSSGLLVFLRIPLLIIWDIVGDRSTPWVSLVFSLQVLYFGNKLAYKQKDVRVCSICQFSITGNILKELLNYKIYLENGCWESWNL